MPRSPKKSPIKKKTITPKKKLAHPSYKEMITEAIMEDKKWTKGSSRQAIKKYIITNYGIEENTVRQKLRTMLRRLTDEDEDGDPVLIQPTVGCFKLNPDWKEEWKKKIEKRSLKKSGVETPKKKRKMSKRKKTVRRKKDKNAPRKNYTAYIIFSNDIRDSIRDKYPNLKFGDISKKISVKWKNLGDSKKDKYKILAAEDKKRYERELKAYKKKKKMSKKSSSTSSSTSTSSSSSSSSSSEEDSKSSTSSSSSEKKKKKKMKMRKMKNQKLI